MKFRKRYKHLVSWWQLNDHRWGWAWRAGNFALAVLLLATIVIPVAQEVTKSNAYKLSADALQLVGKSDPTLANQLTFDDSRQLYQFNKDAVKDSSAASAAQQLQLGTASGKGKDKSLYALDVPKDLSQGVTYHDINSQLGFRLIPEFSASAGQNLDGHLVYPLGSGTQAIYTLKNNGLKEDVVVPEATKDVMSFSYKLDLPAELEAKVIPDSGGNIGIYSADPALFDNISYGSDADQAAIQKARINGEKSHLVFGLPSPTIKTLDGSSAGLASARFELNDDQLTVITDHLTDIKTAFSIDPSVVITATSDFQTNGNNEGMIDFGTSNQITRGGLTGGSVGSWTSTTAFNTARYSHSTVAYNGYIYVMGGWTGSAANDVQYAALNSNGTIGSWSTTTNLPTVRDGQATVASNGYMYILGGWNSNTLNDVYYAPINSNGTIGSWTSTTSFTTARDWFSATVYNGNLYIFGGCSITQPCGTSSLNDVQYAPIKGDGSVGSWSTTSSFTTTRYGLAAVAYNGYMYIMGGCHDGGTVEVCNSAYLSDVQYAAINSDGTLGSWTSTTSFTTGRNMLGASVYNGYLYVMGGYSGAFQNDVQYAQINANGTIGSWTSTNTFTTGRFGLTTAAYNGYTYVLGGCSVGNCTTQINTVYYAKIDPVGQSRSWSNDSTHNLSVSRADICSVAYNGYLYAIGGSTSDDDLNNTQLVEYTAIASNGTIGSWSTTTSLSTVSYRFGTGGCAAYNGYLYIVGGYSGTSTLVNTGAVYYAAINSNGTIGSWTSTNGTTTAGGSYLSVHNAVFVYNGYMYSLAGASQTDDVIYAQINSNGSLGTWTAGTTEVEQTYDESRSFARVGNYLYAMGGEDPGNQNQTNATEYAPINSNGTVGTWSTTGMGTLPANLAFSHATTINGCIYMVGGENNSGTSLNVVYYGCPAANGTVGTWSSANTLVSATTDMGVTSYNGFIYGVGGFTSSVIASTEEAAINGGAGTLGTFATTGTIATCNRAGLASVAYNGYLYIAGGNCAGTLKNDVQYAQINANGTLGTWTADSHTFTGTRDQLTLAAFNGYLYVVGGKSGSNCNGNSAVYCRDIQYAPIGAAGALTSGFTTNGNNFATNGRQGPCTFAYNGYMYVVGGYDGTSDLTDTRYAAINANGSIGTWADSGHNFTNGRSNFSCVVANGYAYILGGDGSSKFNDVQSAAINSNGTLGTWVGASSFNHPRSDAVAAVSNGFMYIMGGIDGSSQTQADTQYAPITAGGTLGNWQNSTLLVTGRNRSAGTAYNGYVYSAGGNDGSNDLGTTEYAPINAISRASRYSKLIDFGGTTNITSITYNGTLPTSNAIPGIAPITYKAAGSNAVFGSSNNSSSISATTNCTGNVTNTRYLLVTFTLDDSLSGIFPDSSGTLANITDFTVNYNVVHPPPNIRLRAGQTLQSGNLSALDTCGA